MVVAVGPDDAVPVPVVRLVVVGPDAVAVLVVTGAVSRLYQAAPNTTTTTTIAPTITLCLMWNLMFVIRIKTRVSGAHHHGMRDGPAHIARITIRTFLPSSISNSILSFFAH